MNLLTQNISKKIEDIENKIVTIKAAAHAQGKKCKSTHTQIASKS